MNDHSRIEELVPLYALDALDEPEAREVERHVADCGECQSELDTYRSISSAMVADEPAPVDIWDRIEAQISEPENEMAPIADLAEERSKRNPMTWLVAVAAVIAFGLGGVLLGQQLALDDIGGDSGVVAAADAAADEPGSLVSEFFVDDVSIARVVLTEDGLGYIVPTDDLETLSADRTYQLWVLTPDELAISAGVLGNDPGPATFTWKGDIAGLALTREVAGGVVSSEGDLVSVITDT